MARTVGPGVAAFNLSHIPAATIRLVAMPGPLSHRPVGGFQTPLHFPADLAAGMTHRITERSEGTASLIPELGDRVGGRQR